MYVTRKTLAECLNLSERRITQLRRKGIITRHYKKGYDLSESVSSYITYKLKPQHQRSLYDD